MAKRTHQRKRAAKLEMGNESVEEQKNLVLWPWVDLLENDDADEFIKYAQHVGLDLGTLPKCDACWGKDLERLILGHYRKRKGVYDIARCADDLASFPPILARYEELMREKRENAEKLSN